MGDLLGPMADLSTDELFVRLLDAELDDDIDDVPRDPSGFASTLVALHQRPSQGVLDRCLALCADPDGDQRCLALRVLRELRHPFVTHERWWPEVEPTVLALATDDPEADVRRAALDCLGWQSRSAEAHSLLLAHVGHHDAMMRFVVAASLPGFADGHDPEPVIAALEALTDDPDPEVRSYALMGLVDDLDRGAGSEHLLRAHVDDPDPQIRAFCRNALGLDDQPSDQGASEPR